MTLKCDTSTPFPGPVVPELLELSQFESEAREIKIRVLTRMVRMR